KQLRAGTMGPVITRSRVRFPSGNTRTLYIRREARRVGGIALGDTPALTEGGYFWLLLERDLQTRSRDLDVRALGLALQVDDDALAVFQRRDPGALAGRPLRARGRVDAVEIRDVRQVVDVSGGLGLRDADLGDREALDLEVVRLSHVAELAPAPVPADAGGHRALRDPDRGRRGLVLRDRRGSDEKGRQAENGQPDCPTTLHTSSFAGGLYC